MSVFTSARKMTAKEQLAYDLGFHEGKTAALDSIVRCKDCVHWVEDIGWCNLHSHILASGEWTMFDPDYYCADAERSEGE